MTVQHCRTCRHHSLKREPRVLSRAELAASGEYGGEAELEMLEGEMEQIATHDGTPEDIERYGTRTHDEEFRCTKQGMKIIGQDDQAGVGCALWEAGNKGARELPPHLLRRMAELEAKAEE